MELLQDKSFLVALLALFGVLINAFVIAYNARKQSDYNERIKKLEFELEQNIKLSERQIATDKKTLDEITNMFDGVEAILFLRDHDFGGSFDREKITPLNRMLLYADEVASRMLIEELEILRMEMVSKGRKLRSLIGQKTFSVNGTTRSSVLPDEYRATLRPEWVEEAAKEINDAANEFVESYDEFVYKSRSILG
jgi:hypothetical protein